MGRLTCKWVPIGRLRNKWTQINTDMNGEAMGREASAVVPWAGLERDEGADGPAVRPYLLARWC